MKACVAVVLSLLNGVCLAQAAYPETEAVAAWRALAASYVRKALRDQTLDRDPALNARVDAAMASIGAAAAAADPRFARSSWTALLIEDFGRGAAAFPGGIILMDAKFVRALQLNDDELALILAHEAAHVLAGHASAKLSFMAERLGKEKVPTAHTALLEFLARDSYAAAFQATERLQEREADRLGAALFLAAGYDPQRALALFDKLARLETQDVRDVRDVRAVQEMGGAADTHDAARVRKRTVSGVFDELQKLPARRGR